MTSYGNRNHLSVNADNSVGDTVILGNGACDTVSALDSYLDTITLGNGGHDTVNVQNVSFPPVVRFPSLFDTITLGNGAHDTVNADGSLYDTITLGNGAHDTVNVRDSAYDTVTLGNGNGDIVNAQDTVGAVITVGNGNDTIHPGINTSITVGTGHDSFVFDQTSPGSVGFSTISNFDPHKDSFTFSKTTAVSYHDDAHGNTVIDVGYTGDTITLMGVHVAQLHPADFHFVDDPAAAISQHLQQLADHHAHTV